MRAVDKQKLLDLENYEYRFTHFSEADFSILKCLKARVHRKEYYNDVIISFDTETSKCEKNKTFIVKMKGKEVEKIHPVRNIVVAWTISIANYEKNLMTVWGSRPSDLIQTIEKIHNALSGEKTIFWCHNLPYDQTFLRQFAFKRWGFPVNQLNVKSHYMLFTEFENGIIFRDSLLLSQRKLEKWGEDLLAEHSKAVGFWDYDKHRNQTSKLSKKELKYIENDTLCLCECLRTMCFNLGKTILTLPYTNTGIVRERIINAALKNGFKKVFDEIALTWEQYQIARDIFMGGYTHGNRYHINQTILGRIKCYDFASSYPYVLMTEKYPLRKWKEIDVDLDTILKLKDEYGFMFKIMFIGLKVKDEVEMPYISFSKAKKTINYILDNGRIIAADMLTTYITEIDLDIILSQYTYEYIQISDAMYSKKSYLPKWFTDEIFEFFKNKTSYKNSDVIQYMINKGMLNALYGLCSQLKIKPEILEDYDTGEFYTQDEEDLKDDYYKVLKKKRTVLPYVIGIWCTCYARKNLFILGSFAKNWYYSDTDSVYGSEWNEKAIKKYNEECKKKIKARGYGSVIFEGREYWLGVAECDPKKDIYSEFRTVGSKRYVCRNATTNKLKLTVSGVPKIGVEQLNDDIRNFKMGFVFKGTQSGKKTHFYNFEKIGIDENGNEYADSIDLCPCDYALSSAYDYELKELLEEEIGVPVYSEEFFDD